MEYRQVGRSGLTVSAVGLGCNNFGTRLDGRETRAVVGRALELGVTFFDTARLYGDGESETLLGAALGSRRDSAVIATKFGASKSRGPDRATASRRNIVRECEDSLRRLATDRIDLYYQHFPDPYTPVEETLAAMDQLVRQGKVRYIAGSNLAAWQIADADHVAARAGGCRFVATQFEWNLLKRGAEEETVPACRHFGVGMIPFFPLASGLLTGKYERDTEFPEGSRLRQSRYFARDATAANFDRLDRLRGIASGNGRTLLELAFGWLLAQDGVPSVIAGASTPAQVAGNCDAAARPLDGAIIAEIAAGTSP